MSQFPRCRRERDGAPSPVPIYRKTLDRRFDFGAEAPGVTLRLRIFLPLWKDRYVPIVLLCWTARGPGGFASGGLNEIVNGLRQEIVSLLRRVSLVERFVCREEGKKRTERIHKVLRVPSQDRRRIVKRDHGDGGTALLPLRRSVLEALTGEPLDEQERGHES